MHFVLLLSTLTVDHSYASASTPFLPSSQASTASSGSSSSALPLGSATIPHGRRDLTVRVSLPERNVKASRLSRRLSLVNSTSIIHYSNLDVTNLATATNGTFYANGTVVRAATASGLNAVFGVGSTTGPSTITSNTNANTGTGTTSTGSSLAAASNSVHQTLLRYAEFSASAYESSCASPMGLTLVQNIVSGSASTSTQTAAAGFVSRDDANKELVVAFRGDPTLQMFNSATLSGLSSNLVDVTSATSYPFGAPAGSSINAELLNAYELYAAGLVAGVRAQLALHSDYGITFTGHGTGGSLASIAAVHHTALLSNKVPIQVITFGAPRIGNAKWAAYTESLFLTDSVARYLRVTRPNDDVPQILATSSGYQHSATELYVRNDGTSSTDITQCTGSEDVNCNDSQLATGQTVNINAGSVVDGGVASSLGSNTQTSAASTSPAAILPSDSSSSTGSGTISGGLDTSAATSANNVPLTSSNSGVSAGVSSSDASVPCSVCKGTECIVCIQDTVRASNSVSGASLQSDDAVSAAQDSDLNTSAANVDSSGSYSSQSAGLTGALDGSQPSIFTAYYSLATNNSSTTNLTSLAVPAINSSTSIRTQEQVANVTHDTLVTNGSLVNVSSEIVMSTSSDNASHMKMTNLLTVTKAMVPTVNAAHLTYLGVNMVNDGADFCTAGKSVLISSAVAPTSNLVTTTAGTGVKTESHVSAAYPGNLSLKSPLSLICAITISIYQICS